MTARRYEWHEGGAEQELVVVRVPGTGGAPFEFGSAPRHKPVEVPDFFIGATQVTQALWQHVMGVNPSVRNDPRCPVDNVSWNHITQPGGFLDRINASPVLEAVARGEELRFRLPSETEWEYAARGGPHWRDGYAFSGSDDPDAVAWHGPNWSGGLGIRPLAVRLFGWRVAWRMFSRRRRIRPPRTHEVATKAANQLGIHDMIGNVWEWCQDTCVDDIGAVPADGSPHEGEGSERRLRGGCHDNWDLHCTVSWRYGIEPDAHDGCIGLRLVLSRKS
jgi:formylglycine-generating enzyme required for sulfatase activity